MHQSKSEGNEIRLLVSVPTVEGEELELIRVSREHMGAYLCIAKNKVPPPVSKRIMLQVHCELLYDLFNNTYAYSYMMWYIM